MSKSKSKSSMSGRGGSAESSPKSMLPPRPASGPGVQAFGLSLAVAGVIFAHAESDADASETSYPQDKDRAFLGGFADEVHMARTVALPELRHDARPGDVPAAIYAHLMERSAAEGALTPDDIDALLEAVRRGAEQLAIFRTVAVAKEVLADAAMAARRLGQYFLA